MFFDDLASALVKRFASGATNWRLRTVPTFVIAHTFCTSRDIRVS